MQGTLDKVGPFVSNHSEELQQEMKAQQSILGPRIKASMQFSEILAGVIGVIGIAIALTAAIFIARSIIGPISGITGAMSELADGNLQTNIPGLDDKNEIGAMANAVDVFKEKCHQGPRHERPGSCYERKERRFAVKHQRGCRRCG